jgi:hypothetical protein
MRVTSSRSKELASGEVGYWHPRSDSAPLPAYKEERREPTINCTRLLMQWYQDTPGRWVSRLADKLGVQEIALGQLGAVYAAPYRAWAFPMRDGYGEIIGIRLRNAEGRKWAVTGSHSGIFLPNCIPHSMALICEGPTDTAAALTLGFYGIGRPSCSGGVPQLCTVVKRLGIRRAVIVADNDAEKEDNYGLNGAVNLSTHLPIPSCVLTLPCKDVRQFVNAGGTRDMFNSMVASLVWTSRNPS